LPNHRRSRCSQGLYGSDERDHNSARFASPKHSPDLGNARRLMAPAPDQVVLDAIEFSK
jgi:hypothetical protein